MTNSKKEFIDKKVYFASLGCSKNLVDAEVMLGQLDLNGFVVTMEADKADVIIVNTCSFIDAAKQESIEVILELADNKKNGLCKALVVSGCMAQRYSSEIEVELPEVDLIIGTGEYYKISELLNSMERGSLESKTFVNDPKFIHTEDDPRINTSPFYTAWLKISEGCNRNCTFCIIPSLRGKLRSRTVGSLIEEAKKFVDSGVRELNIISQDLSDYGIDLGESDNLYNLLDGLEEIENLDWIRLFYFYPDDLTDEVIEKIASSKKVCSYLDMPVQHFSDSVLKRMNRKITGDVILDRAIKLRKSIPDIVLRTSIIVGFPGETEEDFQKLLDGVEEARFNHLGVFKFSAEEGTPAFKMKDKVSQDVIDERYEALYNLQKDIAEELNESFVGKTIEVLIEGNHEETELLIVGRSMGQAPDIDGQVIINDTQDKEINIGDIVKVQVTEVHEYDLIGRIVK